MAHAAILAQDRLSYKFIPTRRPNLFGPRSTERRPLNVATKARLTCMLLGFLVVTLASTSSPFDMYGIGCLGGDT